MELVQDPFYKIHGKFINEDSSEDDSVFGGNKSAEVEAEEEAEDNTVTVPDIVAASKLKQVPTIGSKKDFIKAYVGKLVDKVSETDAEKGKALKANPGLQEFVKMLLADFKQLRFYAGDEDEFDLER